MLSMCAYVKITQKAVCFLSCTSLDSSLVVINIEFKQPNFLKREKNIMPF